MNNVVTNDCDHHFLNSLIGWARKVVSRRLHKATKHKSEQKEKHLDS